MEIRKTEMKDLARLMEIYVHARAFMIENGNPKQWAAHNWPPEELIKEDIKAGKSYVVVNDRGRVVGTFFMDFGEQIEPTYNVITDGAWLKDGPYGVVHRIATDHSEHGIGAFALNWAFEQCGHLRIDTHEDNAVMQHLLLKLGFKRTGIIFIERGHEPRIAFEKVRQSSNP